MKALNVRVAKAVNLLLQRRGRLFVDRFHRRVLTTARSVRNTIIYVLANFRKHHASEARRGWLIDPCSSARYFADFFEGNPVDPRFTLFPNPAGSPVVSARTWLLKTAWKRLGPISLHDHPRPREAQG
ncbi:MAG TPA: hypothetical protein VFQ61_02065 [Polyangiaceae bacterium]|nr:hypothetical protein [Polyangiaceae bacterium]